MIKKPLLIGLALLNLFNITNKDDLEIILNNARLNDDGYILNLTIKSSDKLDLNIQFNKVTIYSNSIDKLANIDVLIPNQFGELNYTGYSNLEFFYKTIEEESYHKITSNISILGLKDLDFTLENGSVSIDFVLNNKISYLKKEYEFINMVPLIPIDTNIESSKITSLVKFETSDISYLDFYLYLNEKKYLLKKQISKDDKGNIYKIDLLLVNPISKLKKDENDAYIIGMYSYKFEYSFRYNIEIKPVEVFDSEYSNYFYTWSIQDV